MNELEIDGDSFLPFPYPTMSQPLDAVELVELYGIQRPTFSQYHPNRRLGQVNFNRLDHFLDKPIEMSHDTYFVVCDTELSLAVKGAAS